MKKTHYGILFAGICVAAFSMGIVAGYLKSRVKSEDVAPIVENVKTVSNEEATVSYVPKKTEHYFLSLESDYIILSEVFNDNTENVIEIAEINKSVLPLSDIELLENGITFSGKDEALMMIENFTS